MQSPIHLRGSVVVPAHELEWRFSRSSGPGGQHVNTSSTAAELRFDVEASSLPPILKERIQRRLSSRLASGVLIVRVDGYRSQRRNREEAKERMREVLLQATAPPPRPRRPTRPSRGAKERRLKEKRKRSEVKRLRSGRFDD